MHHHRNYPYDNSSTTYGQQQLPLSPPTGSYSIPNHQNVYDGHTGTRPYNQIHPGMNTTDEHNSQCYPSPPPSLPHDNQYQIDRYRTSQGPPTSPSLYYGPVSYPYHPPVQRNQQPHTNAGFIPTPSELTQISRYPGASQTPGHTSELTNSEYGIPRRQPLPAERPRTGSGGSPTTANGERFPCEKCGKTFSRSHDRKRHHETQHLPTPVIHRCRYCEKEFSRSDSLKRHVDNGCDEMP
ncbi:hypothetical protein AX14_008372 [Amanita brunnescens Koide BX004]|nr:hypothetical protein AX14_008372 [Amanita brunnescens Koide BX004]